MPHKHKKGKFRRVQVGLANLICNLRALRLTLSTNVRERERERYIYIYILNIFLVDFFVAC